MLDELKSFLQEISPEPGSYLVSCFLQAGAGKIDFYSKEKHRIYTYSREGGKIVMQEDEILQKEKKVLEELKLDEVKVGYEEASAKIVEARDKLIAILQVINGKIIWNFTVLTPTLELYNLKVDAVTGDTISESKENVMNFRV